MDFYKENTPKLIKSLKFIVPVLITVILSFGFVITHSCVNIDTLAYDRYFEKGELLAQGRLTAPLLNKVFGVMNFNPFFVDTIAVILLITASILWCLLFKRVSKNGLKDIVYTVFACLFLSYPLICEIFTYTPSGISIGIGYCFTILALIIGYELSISKEKKLLRIGLQTILLCLAIYLYESFAAVYLCGIFMIFIIEFVYNKEKTKFWELFKKGIVFILPLILGITLGKIIVKILWSLLNVTASDNAAKDIIWLTEGIKAGVVTLIKTFINLYVLASTYYLPITLLAISFVILVILAIKDSVREKSWIVLLLFIGFCVATVALSIVQGTASPYRTCQTFAIFVAFVFMIFTQDILTKCNIKVINNIILFIVFTVVFYQAKELHRQFYINYMRYEHEKNIVTNIGNELLREHDITKPVYFTGENGYSKPVLDELIVSENHIGLRITRKINKMLGNPSSWYDYKYMYAIRYGQTNVNSYLYWGQRSFHRDEKVSVELVKWFNMLGYNIKAGDRNKYEEIEKIGKSNPNHYPKKGYIIETSDYIIVNF